MRSKKNTCVFFRKRKQNLRPSAVIKLPRFSLGTLWLLSALAGSLLYFYVVPSKPFTHEYDLPVSVLRLQDSRHNDFLTFNDQGDKLAVFSGREQRLQLFNLTTHKLIWTTHIQTCYGKMCLQFNEKMGELAYGDYDPGNELWIMDRLKLAAGNRAMYKFDFSQKPDWPLRNNLEYKNKTSPGWQLSIRPALYKTSSYKCCLMDPAPSGTEWAIPSPYPSATPQPICKIVSKIAPESDLQTPTPVVAARYSNDGKKLALMNVDGNVSIWKRSEQFDGRSLSANPFFWIALAAGMGLSARFINRIRKRNVG